MNLAFKKFGNGPALVILHGLYGSGDNWFTIGKNLGSCFTVYLPDLRNHGNSPHSEQFNYELLSDDLEEFFLDQCINCACLIGHSMGGKTALNFTLKNPDKVDKLVVVDIALKSYQEGGAYAPLAYYHRKIVNILLKLDINSTDSRTELDKQLAFYIPQDAERRFILKNLKRNADNKFYWGLNLNALDKNIQRVLDEIDTKNKSFNNPTLLVSGKRSGYINSNDIENYKSVFSNIEFRELDSGHLVHIEQHEVFLRILRNFLNCPA